MSPGSPAPDTRRLGSEGPALVHILQEAGFDEARLAEAESIGRLDDAARLRLIHDDLASAGDVGSLLTLVLTYEGTLTSQGVRRLGSLYDRLIAANLLVADENGGASSPYCVVPIDGLIVLSDKRSGGTAAVMTPAGSSQDLVRLLPATIDGRVLDVGAGPGTLALAAARRGATVVASDVNPRAAQFCRFNAALNGLACDVRVGDLFDAVQGETFDLVLGQPPYLALPPTIEPVTYLHGGNRGHELALKMFADVPDVLAPRGLCLLRFDAPVSPDDLLDQIGSVCENRVDIAVFTVPGAGRDQVAAAAGALEHRRLGQEYDCAVAVYYHHLRDIGVDRTEMAVVACRRPRTDRAGWRRQLPLRRLPDNWEAISRYCDAQDTAELSGELLDAAQVAPAPGAHLITRESLADANDERKTQSVEVAGEGSLATESEVSAAGAALFRILSRDHEIPRATALFAQAFDTPETVGVELVKDFVRLGLSRGLLVPAEGHDPRSPLVR